VTFYILLALIELCHGYLIMQKVEMLSDGQVRIAAGTLYGDIENLLKLRMIGPLESDDPRRKTYVISHAGREILNLDMSRMRHMISVAEISMQEERDDTV